MSDRSLLVLGTSSQVPTRHRNHNGLFIAWDGEGLLLDPGEGTQRQMTVFGLAASRIHRIALTHLHGDHCLGLPGVIQRMSLDRVPHRVTVHHGASCTPFVERLRDASRYDAVADVVLAPHDAPGPLGNVGGAVLTTARLAHTVPTWGYRLQEPDGWTIDPARAAAAGLRGQDLGALQRDGVVDTGGSTVRIEDVAIPRRGRSIAVVMDTRPCAAATALARDVDVLVCESTYLDDAQELAHDRGHMTAEDAGRLAVEAGAGTLVLTHFSQRYPLDAPFAEQAARHHARVITAYDGLVVPIPRGRSAADAPG